MRSLRTFASLFVVCFSLPALAQDAVSLVGTWKGPRERIHSTQEYRADTTTVVITEQKGMTFRGEVRWTSPEGEQSEPFVGAFPTSGKIGVTAGADGTAIYELVNPTTINFCYTEVGSEFLTVCGHLTKQP